MRDRINQIGQAEWSKFFDLHFAECTKAELQSYNWHGNRAALAAIKKRFLPQLVMSHLYWRNPQTGKQRCIGYIDPTFQKSYYMISLNSEYGEGCEVCRGKNHSIARLLEIYQEATSPPCELL